MNSKRRSTVQLLQEFSVPLIAGVVVALAVANVNPGWYDALVHTPITQVFATGEPSNDHHAAADGHDEEHHGPTTDSHDADGQHGHGQDGHEQDSGETHAAVTHEHHASGHGHSDWQHFFTLHFLVNDIFMVLFFGVAAKEITEACLPGGALNPVSKAINPLLGTLGGVVGPVGVYFLANALIGGPQWTNGWGIPTATDIALAWLVARFVFGKGHPAVSFLLLLAVADDAIGLGIIAIAYPNPAHPTAWLNALWILPGMAVALGMRLAKVKSWIPYVACGGALSWWGLFSANLHPALALVFIVPFLPGPRRDHGLYENPIPSGHSPLENFEHQLKMFVDFGLFFFAFANAGVPFSGITNLTWIVFLALLVGKTVGITFFSYAGDLCGFRLPEGMRLKQLVVTAVIAGVGLTVALFVSSQAFVEPGAQGAAKMGALFSGGIALLAIALGKLVDVRDQRRGTSLGWGWLFPFRKLSLGGLSNFANKD